MCTELEVKENVFIKESIKVLNRKSINGKKKKKDSVTMDQNPAKRRWRATADTKKTASDNSCFHEENHNHHRDSPQWNHSHVIGHDAGLQTVGFYHDV